MRSALPVILLTALTAACTANQHRSRVQTLQYTSSGPPPVRPVVQQETAPPVQPVVFRSSVEGCFRSGTNIADSTTRRRPLDGVTVAPVEGGVVVAHTFAHACCLQEQTRAVVAGSVVTITESITGESCRCMCSSTVRTVVDLPPGSYRLRVITEVGGQIRQAHEQPLTVGAAP